MSVYIIEAAAGWVSHSVRKSMCVDSFRCHGLLGLGDAIRSSTHTHTQLCSHRSNCTSTFFDLHATHAPIFAIQRSSLHSAPGRQCENDVTSKLFACTQHYYIDLQSIEEMHFCLSFSSGQGRLQSKHSCTSAEYMKLWLSRARWNREHEKSPAARNEFIFGLKFKRFLNFNWTDYTESGIRPSCRESCLGRGERLTAASMSEP